VTCSEHVEEARRVPPPRLERDAVRERARPHVEAARSRDGAQGGIHLDADRGAEARERLEQAAAAAADLRHPAAAARQETGHLGEDDRAAALETTSGPGPPRPCTAA